MRLKNDYVETLLGIKIWKNFKKLYVKVNIFLIEINVLVKIFKTIFTTYSKEWFCKLHSIKNSEVF